MSTVPSPSPAARAAERIRQIIVARMQFHPDAIRGFADEVTAIIEQEYAPQTAQLAAAQMMVDWTAPHIDENRKESGRQVMSVFDRNRMERLAEAVDAWRAATKFSIQSP